MLTYRLYLEWSWYDSMLMTSQIFGSRVSLISLLKIPVESLNLTKCQLWQILDFICCNVTTRRLSRHRPIMGGEHYLHEPSEWIQLGCKWMIWLYETHFFSQFTVVPVGMNGPPLFVFLCWGSVRHKNDKCLLSTIGFLLQCAHPMYNVNQQ